MLCRFLCLACVAACFAASPAFGRLIIKERSLDSTAAWGNHIKLLQENSSAKPVPPFRVPAYAGAAHSYSPGVLPGEVPHEWRDRISRASSRHGIESALLAAMLKVESNFNPFAVSPKGARGAMQIMPITGKQLGLQNFFDPDENLDAGAGYLASLLKEFATLELALAAYNAGPEAVRRHGGIPPYEETRTYVVRVLDLFGEYRVSSP